jgi:hypothetical protein
MPVLEVENLNQAMNIAIRTRIAIISPVLAIFVVLSAFSVSAPAQEVVDKTVAVVSDSARRELITYSDILWQMALQPGTTLEKPNSEELNQALQILINQRIFALEAERLPRSAPTEKEIADKIAETLSHFPSAAVFEARLKQVGFDSIKDPNFERLVSQRVAIEKYIDFRFNSFVVITPDDEAKYYRDVFVLDFRRRSPGVLVPTLEERRTQIHDILTSQKVAANIESFLEEAKRRVRVEVLIAV